MPNKNSNESLIVPARHSRPCFCPCAIQTARSAPDAASSQALPGAEHGLYLGEDCRQGNGCRSLMFTVEHAQGKDVQKQVLLNKTRSFLLDPRSCYCRCSFLLSLFSKFWALSFSLSLFNPLIIFPTKTTRFEVRGAPGQNPLAQGHYTTPSV